VNEEPSRGDTGVDSVTEVDHSKTEESIVPNPKRSAKLGGKRLVTKKRELAEGDSLAGVTSRAGGWSLQNSVVINKEENSSQLLGLGTMKNGGSNAVWGARRRSDRFACSK